MDQAVRHVLTIRIRLGQFDPDGGPYAEITADVLDSPAHRELNRQAAEEAMVLLRNGSRRCRSTRRGPRTRSPSSGHCTTRCSATGTAATCRTR